MNFEFFYQEQPTADLEIEDIGNVAIVIPPLVFYERNSIAVV